MASVDPLWAVLADVWWIGPVVIGSGALGWLGVRRQRTWNARHLEFDAARQELRAARSTATAARVRVKVARAELARTQAERAAGRADASEVAAVRHELQRADREVRAANAGVRASRAQVGAARALLPAGASDPAALPLARLMAAHDAVTARWLEYETDPAKLIAFPTMTDARDPRTSAFLDARRQAQELRPATPQERITPPRYTAYRDAVRKLERAFAAAEEAAWGQARREGTIPPDPAEAPHWSEVAQSVAQSLWARGADALGRVTGSPWGTDRADRTAPGARSDGADAGASGAHPPRTRYGSGSPSDSRPRHGSDSGSPSDSRRADAPPAAPDPRRNPASPATPGPHRTEAPPAADPATDPTGYPSAWPVPKRSAPPSETR